MVAATKVPESVAKAWWARQALWQIFLPALHHIPRRRCAFDVPTPNAIHQADLLVLPHDKLPSGRKVYKYSLTVANIARHYNEPEPLTSKNFDEVAQAFQKIYRHLSLTWP